MITRRKVERRIKTEPDFDVTDMSSYIFSKSLKKAVQSLKFKKKYSGVLCSRKTSGFPLRFFMFLFVV